MPEDYEFLRYEDKGLSGYYSDRPDFQRLLRDIETGKMACYKLDRISRKTADLMRLLEYFERYEVTLLVCSNNINTQISTSKIIIQVLAIIAEFERDILTKRMQEVTLFEDFIEALNANNRNSGQLIVNSMYVLDNQKQRDKMAQEFYIAMRREVELYQEGVKHFIDTNITSPAVMSRWIAKIDALEEKRRHYEGIFRRQLDDLSDEFSTLQMFSQDLQVRVQRQERQKKAA